MREKLSPEAKAQIWAYFDMGISQKEISEKIQVSKSTVSKTVKRYQNRGYFNRKSGSGRKKILSAENLKFLEKKIAIDPKIGSRKLKTSLADEKSIIVSERTIRRDLCSINLNGRVACEKPLLSKINIGKRFDHAKEWINFRKEDWERIIWSDETKINLFGSDGRTYVRRKPGTRYHNSNLKPTVKLGGGNIMIWGCFSYGGVGEITIIDGNMNADGYCRILDTCLFESAEKLGMTDFYFQHDNDPKHTSAKVKEYLDLRNIKTMSWPPQSPDMNPIENLWHHLKVRVEERKPKNIKNLKEIVIEEWKRIPPEFCKKLVNSMHRRAFDLWMAKGAHTKY